MGFWNKLGKIALQAAPYVAAPFTGGASLAFAPAARQLGQKWSEHDARVAAEKGLGPSRFDTVLGAASEYGGMAGGMGAYGKGNFSSKNFDRGYGGGSIFGRGGSSGRYPMDEKIGIGMDEMRPDGSGGLGGGMGRGGGGGWQDMLRQAMDRYGSRDSGGSSRGQGGYSYGRGDESSGGGYGQMGVSRFGRRMQRQLGPVMGAEDQSNPNLAMSIGAGRMDAMRNQPWRGGYDVNTQEQDDNGNNIGDPMTTSMPPVYPGGGRRRRMYN